MLGVGRGVLGCTAASADDDVDDVDDGDDGDKNADSADAVADADAVISEADGVTDADTADDDDVFLLSSRAEISGGDSRVSTTTRKGQWALLGSRRHSSTAMESSTR